MPASRRYRVLRNPVRFTQRAHSRPPQHGGTRTRGVCWSAPAQTVVGVGALGRCTVRSCPTVRRFEALRQGLVRCRLAMSAKVFLLMPMSRAIERSLLLPSMGEHEGHRMTMSTRSGFGDAIIDLSV